VRALLATDEILGRAAALALSHGRIETRIVADPTQVLTELTRWKPELVMIDADRSPEGIHQIRQRSPKEKTAIIAFARRRRLPVKMGILDSGADDLIEAPFTPDEIFGRPVSAAKRMGLDPIPFRPVIEANGLEIDLAEERVRSDGVWLPLGIADLALVYLFAGNPDVVFTSETVNDNLWGPDFEKPPHEIGERLRVLLGHQDGGSLKIVETLSRDHFRLAA
jgi:two-component system, OmpR family, KDP operon response regulator KdpE